MKISVIVPTYKPKDYLWECLESIYNQTFSKKEYELILVLNGCGEPYGTRIVSWLNEHTDLQVLYIQTDIGGVSNARNMALDIAKGEYITFIDDDDFISSSYLKELYEKASRTVVSLCYPLSFVDKTTNYIEYYITGDYNRNSDKKDIPYEKARKYFSGPVYKLIHRDIIADRRFDLRFKNGEDSIFMFLISDRFEKVEFTSRNAIYYRRIREGSALARKKPFIDVVKNQLNMVCAYCTIYFKHPLSYKLNFFFTRVLGAIHGAIEQI